MMKLYLVNVQLFVEAEDEENADAMANELMSMIPTDNWKNGYNVTDTEEVDWP